MGKIRHFSNHERNFLFLQSHLLHLSKKSFKKRFRKNSEAQRHWAPVRSRGAGGPGELVALEARTRCSRRKSLCRTLAHMTGSVFTWHWVQQNETQGIKSKVIESRKLKWNRSSAKNGPWRKQRMKLKGGRVLSWCISAGRLKLNWKMTALSLENCSVQFQLWDTNQPPPW